MSADGFCQRELDDKAIFLVLNTEEMEQTKNYEDDEVTKRKCFLCFGGNGGLKNQKNIPPTVGIRHRRHTKRNKGEGEGIGWPQGRISD